MRATTKTLEPSSYQIMNNAHLPILLESHTFSKDWIQKPFIS